MDPLTMAVVGGGLSFVSSYGARQAAAKTNKINAAKDLIANEQAQRERAADNKRNKDLAKALLKVKEVTKTEESGKNVSTTEHSEGETSFSETHATTQQDETHDNYSFVDTEAMMEAADRAGFNPVTWLNAGGMQAYTQTGSRDRTTVTSDSSSFSQRDAWAKDVLTEEFGKVTTETRTGHNAAAAYAMMSPESALVQSTPAVTVPSIAQAIGDAGTAALKVYQQEQNKLDSQAFQQAMLDKQLAAIQSSNKNRGGNTGNPATGTSGTGNGTPSIVTSGSTAKGQTGGGLGDKFKIETPEIVAPFKRFFNFDADPSFASAQTIEDDSGEIVSSAYGIPKFIANAQYSLTGVPMSEHYNFIRDQLGLPAAGERLPKNKDAPLQLWIRNLAK